MLRELLILGYAATVGFVASGIVASLYQLLTSQPAKFALLGKSALAAFSTFIFCAVTGPVIIMNRALSARRTEKEPVGWLFGSAFVALLWSCCSGIVVLGFALSLRDSLV